jgi:hypothetical protein
MLRLLTNCLLIALLAALTSCTTVPQMQEKLAQAAELTLQVSEMIFTPLQTSVEQTITFGDKTPIFQFEAGKGYYSAFSIPEPRQPRQLKVKTSLTSEYLPTAGVLIPNMLILNSNKQQIGKIENYRLEHDVNFFTGTFYFADVPIPAEAAYLVAYAATSNEEHISAYSENGTEYVLPLAPAGKFTLTAGQPLAMDFDFTKAVIKDSVTVLGSDKADFFYVESIDDKSVKNSLARTAELNRGRGFQMEPHIIDREVPANKSVKLSLAGKTHYGAPIQELFNKTYEVKGQITFTPVKGKKYVVKGEMNDELASVWLEDEESHQVVDKKIEKVGKVSGSSSK